MSSTVLERTRSTHEEIEQYVRALCAEIGDAGSASAGEGREQIHQRHRMASAVHGLHEASERLIALYDDADGERREQLAKLGGHGPQLYSVFYERLRETKDYHRRFPNLAPERIEDVLANVQLPSFSGEEGHGRFVDMNTLYTEFINLPHVLAARRATTRAHRPSSIAPTAPTSDAASEVSGKRAKSDRAHDSDGERGGSDSDTDDERGRKRPRLGDGKHEERERRSRDERDERHNVKHNDKHNDKHNEGNDKGNDKSNGKSGMAAMLGVEAELAPPISYMVYLDNFYRFDVASLGTRASAAYVRYVQRVRDYLVSFLERVDPLFDVHKHMADLERAFENDWAQHQRRWLAAASSVTAAPAASATPTSAAAHEPLYCTACRRLFTRPTIFRSHLTGKKHKRALARQSHQPPAHQPVTENGKAHADSNGASTSASASSTSSASSASSTSSSNGDGDVLKEVARHEAVIVGLAARLRPTLEETKAEIERKQGRTVRQVNEEVQQRDVDEEEEHAELSDDDEEETKLRIANYPTDWNGDPIPYWLYKLHGLGIEYKCEICGNQSYWGRRAFERHFQEWRHAHGMRCLGVPNSKHFHEITKIQDAIDLYDKIKVQRGVEEWRADEHEEFEDTEGNVLDKKTFSYLKKQGLV